MRIPFITSFEKTFFFLLLQMKRTLEDAKTPAWTKPKSAGTTEVDDSKSTTEVDDSKSSAPDPAAFRLSYQNLYVESGAENEHGTDESFLSGYIGRARPKLIFHPIEDSSRIGKLMGWYISPPCPIGWVWVFTFPEPIPYAAMQEHFYMEIELKFEHSGRSGSLTLPFGCPRDEENQVLGKPYDNNNHLELDCRVPHVFLTREKILPDEEYNYPKDFDFDGMDAFTEMSDVQTDLVARMSFKVDKAKRHVLGFMGIQIGDVQHHGSYESERSDSHIFIWTNWWKCFFHWNGTKKRFLTDSVEISCSWFAIINFLVRCFLFVPWHFTSAFYYIKLVRAGCAELIEGTRKWVILSVMFNRSGAFQCFLLI